MHHAIQPFSQRGLQCDVLEVLCSLTVLCVILWLTHGCILVGLSIHMEFGWWPKKHVVWTKGFLTKQMPTDDVLWGKIYRPWTQERNVLKLKRWCLGTGVCNPECRSIFEFIKALSEDTFLWEDGRSGGRVVWVFLHKNLLLASWDVQTWMQESYFKSISVDSKFWILYLISSLCLHIC